MPPHTRPGDPLSPRQRDVFDAIRRYYLHTGFPPTIRLIAVAIGLPKSSPNAVLVHLRPLVAKGKLRAINGHRSGGKGTVYVPVTPELVATGVSDTVHVAMSGPGVTMSRQEWRQWLTRELERLRE